MQAINEKNWIQISYKKSIAESLYKSLNIGFPLCVILAQREIRSKEEAEKFLWPKLTYLDDPFRIKNIDRAVDILSRVIEHNLRIAIVGDYDVDGITSITLLINVLKTFGISPNFFVPRRACEGYGLSSEIIERILSKKKYDVVVTLDCGTNSAEEVDFLQKNGIEVLIVDHHQAQILPVAKCCIINPHISENNDDDKYKTLCSVGLVFKLCCALLRTLRKKNDQRAINYQLKHDLDLVTLGTIADMMRLVGENRVFCKFGLKILNGKFRRPGIEALCKSADIHAETNIHQSDISFKLCPRLNACGRLRDAVLPVKMMLSDNFDEAMTYAYELDETNKERQLIEKEITQQADKIVKTCYADDSAIVLYNKNWHAGVVGIISGKFARDYSKPCIVLGNERDLAKGSGRSANGINLIDILGDCSPLLEAWGGHPYAVGISISPKNIDEFRIKFNAAVEKYLGNALQQIKSEYDYELELEAISNGFMEELEMLQPFGQKNPEPIFLLRNIKISNLPESFGVQKNHVKFWLADKYSKRMLVIGWNGASNIPPINTPLDIMATVNRETWNRIHSTCLHMISWRMTERE
ncbi:MAG: single-stranded-DNA-specific exonuclease RecJ [Puniceicoccales bacterium]|jgi:single-stranded-DNA-specific exonuclease|nr:single-stranded-DNA-specific exonuclease RecJ [Puniceicoccales bacterium]